MWRVEYTKRFLKELSRLPQKIRVQAEKIVFEDLVSVNPFNLKYIDHLTEYSDKYKIRIGKYRIGITPDPCEL